MRSALAVLAFALAACSPPDSRYYPASELDAKPFPLRPVDLDLPSAPSAAEYYGKLKLHVYIGAAGGVDRVEVVESGVPPGFRDAAVKAFSDVRWEPARKAGERVRSLKVIEVDFKPPPQGERPAMRPD